MAKLATRSVLVIALTLTLGVAAALLLRDVTKGGAEPYKATQTPQDTPGRRRDQGPATNSDVPNGVGGNENSRTLTSVLAGAGKGQVQDVPAQAILSEDSPLESVTLAHLSYGTGDVPTLQITLRGNFQSAAESRFAARLPNGEQVYFSHSGSSYRKDATGAISYGTTEIDFPLGNVEEWRGVVRFFHGETDEMIRGDWRIALSP